MRSRIVRIFIAAVVVVSGVVPAAAVQAATDRDGSSVAAALDRWDTASTGLWLCRIGGQSFDHACTTIKNAPSGGVRVLDRITDRVYTFQNGNSVALDVWYTDPSGRCGVHGNRYVWSIVWFNNEWHHAYIGDYYLNTGTVSNWSGFWDHAGPLGDRNWGEGTGTCDVFP